MKIKGILLASGASRRLGRPKQLLPWHGKLLINAIIDTINSSCIDELIVVLGYARWEIKDKLDQNIHVLLNDDWRAGKSAAIKKGLESTGPDVDAVIFFTIDQPFLTPDLIDTIINTSSKSDASIIATRINCVLTIPMLFKKDCFSALEKLEGEAGGKRLLKDPDREIDFVEWDDERILIDIDSEADYEIALRLYDAGS